MYSWSERLDIAILNNDIANINRLLHASQAYKTLDKVFIHSGPRKARHNGRLHIAAYSNSVKAAQILIQYGEDVNSRNCIGDTPLHVAARYNAWETADLLISCGAEVDIQNKDSQTPMDIALSCGNHHLAELLMLVQRQSMYG
ncbi:ankyrin repeat domain-containing protein [bacterium]|nr:ankyrin repeat domain-containing protein [bacterium]